jgi:hypothetical protein
MKKIGRKWLRHERKTRIKVTSVIMIFEFEFELTSKRKGSSKKSQLKLIYFLLEIKIKSCHNCGEKSL